MIVHTFSPSGYHICTILEYYNVSYVFGTNYQMTVKVLSKQPAIATTCQAINKTLHVVSMHSQA